MLPADAMKLFKALADPLGGTLTSEQWPLIAMWASAMPEGTATDTHGNLLLRFCIELAAACGVCHPVVAATLVTPTREVLQGVITTTVRALEFALAKCDSLPGALAEANELCRLLGPARGIAPLSPAIIGRALRERAEVFAPTPPSSPGAGIGADPSATFTIHRAPETELAGEPEPSAWATRVHAAKKSKVAPKAKAAAAPSVLAHVIDSEDEAPEWPPLVQHFAGAAADDAALNAFLRIASISTISSDTKREYISKLPKLEMIMGMAMELEVFHGARSLPCHACAVPSRQWGHGLWWPQCHAH